MVTRVKICGLTRPEDVELAAMLGAHAVGFVLEATSPRCVSKERAEAMAKLVRPYCLTVGVYGRTNDDLPKLDAIQSVHFTHAVPSTKIQAVRVAKETTVEEVLASVGDADALLVDAFSTQGYGGTGKRVDWNFAAEVVRACPKPVILAGGLTPENVGRAIEIVRPYAVDVSSGIESAPGIKDQRMMRDFISAAL